ncbi:TIGR03085 family protein [Corynebacterium sp. TAE3-ERU12]|uniref:TIGR03085 family metal-binding protein n=1 Tax=Corynebacterium sp. TAE3-ERU12 TaxID=2849491 RepID=UPI001C450FEE|nr:TIGR03085 family metal-binding protein [Corynebacterium sp. TAE3-ERU12]MBV7295266.1 TIGR03085 family protein [Corynebacterium sp. TAE3-ERU12]
MTFSSRERRALADLLLELGPNQPTLCEGWNTKDMVVHMRVREARPDAAAGMFVPALSGHLDKVSSEIAANTPYTQLVRQWAGGAPMWNPVRWLDRWVNPAENFVHHEDVRRGQDAWMPRNFGPGDTEQLWSIVRTFGKVLLSKSPVDVVLQRPDGEAAKVVDKKSSQADAVTVTGEPGELLLWAFGRDAVEVEVDGDASGIKRGF